MFIRWSGFIIIKKSKKQNYIESTAYEKKPGLNHQLSCTQHKKQNKQRNKNFKWAIQFLAIATLHLIECKTNGQKKMVLINVRKMVKKNGPYQF